MITITMADTTNTSGKCFNCPQVELGVPLAEYLKKGSYLPWCQDTSDLESGKRGRIGPQLRALLACATGCCDVTLPVLGSCLQVQGRAQV
jgi:hypothetical protein